MTEPKASRIPVVCIPIKVIPSSSRNMICGWYGKQIKIKVQAPPEGGRANKAVLALISKTFDCNRADVRIVSGQRSVDKLVEVVGLTEEDLKERNF